MFPLIAVYNYYNVEKYVTLIHMYNYYNVEKYVFNCTTFDLMISRSLFGMLFMVT